MKVNFNSFNFTSSIKSVPSVNTLRPSFKSQGLSSDMFVRTTNPVEKTSELEEIRSGIPAYLYHLTNIDSYEKIMEEGRINLSKELIDGVFMFDMEDFQKNWTNTPNSSKTGTLAQSLVEQALKTEKGLVLMRIPTKNLDPMKFTIRPEDEVTKYLKSTEFFCLTAMFERKGGILSHKELLPKDLVEGFSPATSKEYFEAGRPIEYIYRGNIDLNEVSVENIFELPEMDRRTIWGYGPKHFNELFEIIAQNA